MFKKQINEKTFFRQIYKKNRSGIEQKENYFRLFFFLSRTS